MLEFSKVVFGSARNSSNFYHRRYRFWDCNFDFLLRFYMDYCNCIFLYFELCEHWFTAYFRLILCVRMLYNQPPHTYIYEFLSQQIMNCFQIGYSLDQ